MKTTVLDSLNAGLLSALDRDETVHLLGEDILDPYGGAFKVTRGCSTAHPRRVWAAPISEAGLAGVAAGMALRGLRPVLEIMFGDFTTLLADQLINHISKFRWMYNNTVRLPLVIRTPMGGRRGYGPTHSQTLEKLYLGVPGLRVIAPTNFVEDIPSQSPGQLLANCILDTEDPILFIENKLQYLLPLYGANGQPQLEIRRYEDDLKDGVSTPAYVVRVKGAPPPTVTMVAYGYMADMAHQAMIKLAYEEEIVAELVVMTRLAPFDPGALLESVRRTSKLVTIEEGGLTLGWGTELIARLVELLPGRLAAARVAARDLPVPAALSLEQAVLPQMCDILRTVRKVVHQDE